MQIWRLPRRILVKPLSLSSLSTLSKTRCLSSAATRPGPPHTEHVQVSYASAGTITLSLHDVQNHPPSAPLIINLPAFPTHDVDDVDSYLPRFLRQFPTVTIHYRWTNKKARLDPFSKQKKAVAAPHKPSDSLSRYTASQLNWPTPLHDTVSGYEWLVKNLLPESEPRDRAVYVYGSYLGASLASSLALTEAHTLDPMGITGLLAFNGIYNWSRMLPQHPSNSVLEHAAVLGVQGVGARHSDQDVAPLKDLVTSLFTRAADVLDPFASPVLFFHTPGMLDPPTFDEPPPHPQALYSPLRDIGRDITDPNEIPFVYSDLEELLRLTSYDESDADAKESLLSSQSSSSSSSTTTSDASPKRPRRPRQGHLAYPPRGSHLRIPDTLLLHTPSAVPWANIAQSAAGEELGAARLDRVRGAENSFEAHARGLAGLMRKSVAKMEWRDIMRYDPEVEHWDGHEYKRIGVENVGDVPRDRKGRPKGSWLGPEGEAIALRWLEERT